MTRPKLRIVTAKPEPSGWVKRSHKEAGDILLVNSLKPVVIVSGGDGA